MNAVIALQWDRGRWRWLLAMIFTSSMLWAMGDGVADMLRYERGAVAAGGWWRLLTTHALHMDLHHLILNSLGLVLVWALFAEDYDPVQWCVIVLGGALAISSGLWWLSPGVVWYVGASGVLHTVMAAGAARHLAEGIWDRWILCGGLVSKVAFEQFEQWRGLAAPFIVVDAHLYGAVSGFAIGAVFSARLAIIRSRSTARRP